MPHGGQARKETDSSYPETRGRAEQVDRIGELEEESVRCLEADNHRRQQEATPVTTSAADVTPTNTAPSYTSSGVPLSVPEDAGRALVAGPTSSREFGRTCLASSDVEG